MAHAQQKEAGGDITKSPPYCQIAKGFISAKYCGKVQGQDGCVGCGALTRRCESCGKRIVDIPAVGLCEVCLEKELGEEKKQEQKGLYPDDVPCKACRKRKRRFEKYGMCLRCSYDRYGKEDFSTPLPANDSANAHGKAPHAIRKGRKKNPVPDVIAVVAQAQQQIALGTVRTFTELRRHFHLPQEKKFWREMFQELLKKGLARAPKSKGGRWFLILPSAFKKEKKRKILAPPRTASLSWKLVWLANNFFKSGSPHAAMLHEAAKNIKELKQIRQILRKHTKELQIKGFAEKR